VYESRCRSTTKRGIAEIESPVQRADSRRGTEVTGAPQFRRATELVVYPDQFHSFTRPSFIRDRYERYLAWYDKYLKPPASASGGQ
jgi:hypothetical protein